MYGADPVRLYDTVRRAADGWREILKERSIEIGVLETTRRTDSPLLDNLHDSPDWALVYWDDNSAVYVERTPGRAAFLAETYVYTVRPDESFGGEGLSRTAVTRARRDYATKLEEDPDCVLALQGLAECLRMESSLPEAAELLRRAAGLQPHNGALAYNLGACLLAMGDLDGAERRLQHALRLGEYEVQANKALAVVYDQRGNTDEALRRLKRALRHSPPDAPRRWEIHWNISLIQEKRGRIREAVAAMEAAARLVPNHPAVVRRLNELRQKQREGTGNQP